MVESGSWRGKFLFNEWARAGDKFAHGTDADTLANVDRDAKREVEVPAEGRTNLGGEHRACGLLRVYDEVIRSDVDLFVARNIEGESACVHSEASPVCVKSKDNTLVVVELWVVYQTLQLDNAARHDVRVL